MPVSANNEKLTLIGSPASLLRVSQAEGILELWGADAWVVHPLEPGICADRRLQTSSPSGRSRIPSVSD